MKWIVTALAAVVVVGFLLAIAYHFLSLPRM